MEKNSQSYYYHFDGLGSVTSISPFTYTDREYDSESGLYFYRARYYDAKIGRFVIPDPSLIPSGNPNIPCLLEQQLQTPQELNPFVYTMNNPVNWVDLFGANGYKAKECSFVHRLMY